MLRVGWLALGSAAAARCGYSLAGRGSFLPEYIKTIGIPAFVNRTTIFNLETMITEKVRSEFISRGRYQIVPAAEGVDAVLTGEVTAAFVRPQITSPDQQIATRYIISMSASANLKDTRENRVVWENPRLSFQQEYEAQGAQNATDPAAFFGQDQNALERMTSEFARTIVAAILEAF
jgi:predicted transcriptional regulator of viral defense system